MLPNITASIWWMLKRLVTATSRQMPSPSVMERNTPISVSVGSAARRFAYTIATAHSRQKPKMPP